MSITLKNYEAQQTKFDRVFRAGVADPTGKFGYFQFEYFRANRESGGYEKIGFSSNTVAPWELVAAQESRRATEDKYIAVLVEASVPDPAEQIRLAVELYKTACGMATAIETFLEATDNPYARPTYERVHTDVRQGLRNSLNEFDMYSWDEERKIAIRNA